MLQEKNMQVFIGPVLKEGRFKSIKLCTIFVLESSNGLCVT